ncbi:RNA-binding protein [Spirosoma sp. KCTC 42546]|uniref:VCBS repeat-containing protein n=1 Tax=Spirosoma sp. KCTC 42546 TaxID=2520506 RepID=UPI00115A260B|nr:VCBS repeat-containing protein [Spirosoma sp. KCTC 42546]QDK83261.1 RNA-binding protein [Spirosoma sp. KCTC 42546]
MKRIAFFLTTGLLTLAGCNLFKSEKQLFQTLDSTQTGIGFINHLVPTEKVNILDYLYFYNGGGVSAGDINNDGLTDLYFVSNQGKNKLYLNKGNFKFEDITEKAGVAGFSDWQTGSTMADVNGDGFLDIYVCAVGNFRGLEGANELYINNGDGTFTEKAADYGLDFTGFSTQAAFFDYDHDGDLDCYLLNHAVHTSRSYDRVTARNLRHNESGDYLYKNMSVEQGAGNKVSTSAKLPAQRSRRFINVSEQAGIFGAAMGYGLGISVADLNNDGWEDLYISNDFHEDDYYYVNNHNGTFTESVKKAFQHTSRFSMGNDVADVNNDGFADVVTLDMYPEDETVEKSSLGEDPLDIYLYKLAYGYMNQYSRNCLQLNLSGKKFMDVGAMAGVAATDWSWSPLLADYDNDGIKDLFITNGIVHRPNNLDYVKFAADDSLRYAMETSKALDDRAIKLMPEGKVHNYMYRGTSSMHFDDKSAAWGFTALNYSNGAAYADLDNDGDLDLITNNIDDPAGLYRNEANTIFPDNRHLTVKLKGDAPNTFGVGGKVIIKYGGSSHGDSIQVQQMMLTRGFESSVAPELLFGLGKREVIDSLIVIWPNQRMEIRTKVKANQSLTLKQADAQLDGTNYRYTTPSISPLFTDVTNTDSIPYKHQENKEYFDYVREPLMPFQVSTEGPHLAVADVNGDGLEDIYAGGAKWKAGSLLIQQPDGKFKGASQPDFVKDSTYEDVDAAFFDADGDKDLDLYVVSGGNEFYNQMTEQFDRLYLNDGHGNFSRSANSLPSMFDNKSCVRPCDVDNDGDLDLFVGGRVVGFGYGKSPNSYLLINDGKGHFSDQTEKRADGLRKAGMVTDAVWADYDNDKDLDLVLAGDWMPIRVFANNDGKFTEVKSITTDDTPLSGFYQRIIAADFDRDGDIDLMAANLGTNTKFRKAPDSQLRMWVKDVDKNQSPEQIIAYNRVSPGGGKEWYPLAFKDELGKQIPSIINKRFTDYVSFAGKPLNEVLNDDELKGAEEFTVDQFASIYLENQNGKFVVHELPMMAQVSKLFALQAIDIDQDGDLDVLGGGNFYGVSTYQGRYDASYGLVMRNDGKGGFTALSPIDCGFLLNGEIRDIRPVRTGRGLLLVVARNNAGLQVFKSLFLK